MAYTRTQIMNQLASVVFSAKQSDGVTPMFVTTGRRLLTFEQCPQQSQPAAFLLKDHETRLQNPTKGVLSKLEYNVRLIIYTYCSDPASTPANILDQCLDAVDAVLKPPPGQQFNTLGGYCFYCVVNGKVDIAPGDDDHQGLAVVPLLLLIP